jgi:cytochrome c-type biogenesis protein CcmE
VIALAVAGLLALFLLYTSVAGDSRASVKPSTLVGHTGKVSLTGRVVGNVSGDAHSAGGLRFAVTDIGRASATVPVVFHGTVPDLFRSGRDVVVDGQLRNGVFFADNVVTKCPSKYAPAKGKSSAT